MKKKYEMPKTRIRYMTPIVLTEISNIYVGRDYGRLDSKGFGTFSDDDDYYDDEQCNII